MYERRVDRLASPETFRRRLLNSGAVALALITGSLAIGMAGYAFLEDLGFVDAFLNASMILSGMGPVHNPDSTAGKLFAGFYALYSGFAVIAIAAILVAPVIHRLFHRFHIEESGEDDQKKASPRAKKR